MRGSVAAFAAVIAAACSTCNAAVNLEFRPVHQVVNVGDTVGVGLYAVSDDSQTQFTSAIDVVLAWQNPFLQLLGVDGTGAAPLLSSAFFSPDGHGLNENPFPNPPQDGDGFYTAFAMPGSPLGATPAGTLVTTFQFLAIAPTALTPVDMLVSAGTPAGFTTVFHPTIPATPITGTLSGAGVTILIPSPAATLVLALGVIARPRRRR